MRWACIALWVCACGKSPPASDAFVRVVVTALTSSARITRVSVTVTPASASADLAPDAAGTFSGTLSVPAGPQAVTASAWADARLVGSGSGSVLVASGQTAQLFIAALDVTGPAPVPDHSPVVTSLAVSATAVALGDQVSLTATAMDADRDAITFGWSALPAGCGTFASPGSASTTWSAAAAGTCVVTLTASARGQSDSRSTSILVSGAPTPTLVQHLSSSTNPAGNGIPGNHFKFTLPENVGQGNCLILGISYAFTGSLADAPVTDNRNAWPASPAVTVNDRANLTSAIFILPDAKAGLTTIAVHFTAPVLNFQYTISEFYNVATTSPVDGASSSFSTSGSTTGGVVSSGSFTPVNNDANGGNLIWSYFADNTGGLANQATNFAAGTNFSLLHADIAWGPQGMPTASQYWVQSRAAAIDPSTTVTLATGADTFNAASVALKAASAGTPPASNLRIVHVAHQTATQGMMSGKTSWNLQFPSTGNFVLVSTTEPNNIQISSITDTKRNSYTKECPDDSTEPQMWHADNATTDLDSKLTVNFAASPLATTWVLYDIAGVAAVNPVDTVVGVPSVNCNTCPTFCTEANDSPIITPASSGGMVITSLTLGIGPSIGFGAGAPAPAFFDLVNYAGESDNDLMDNADGKAHFYNPDTTTEHWNWVVAQDSCVSTSYASLGIHIKAAPLAP